MPASPWYSRLARSLMPCRFSVLPGATTSSETIWSSCSSVMSRLLRAVPGATGGRRGVLAGMVQNPAEATDPRREERRHPGQHRHDRVPEEEHDHEVERGRQAQREREALHLARTDDVQHQRGENRDRVGRDDGAPGADPGPRYGAARTSTLTDLVFEPFEVDDERVGRDTERHDEAGDSGERQREADLAAQEN